MRFAAPLALFCAPLTAQAQLALPPEDAPVPSALAPLASDSPWTARFDAAAAVLGPALIAEEAVWLPHFGGQWLGHADRARIGAMLADPAGALRQTLGDTRGAEHIVLGWRPAGDAAAFANLGDRPEGEAMICWRARGSGAAWPATAAEAEAGGRHACVRVSYSIRFETPQWRAFLDAAPD
jgi:hypothetical protein